MTDMQSMDDIKQYFNNEALPKIDVKTSVMTKIEELSNAKKRRRPARKMVLVIATCISIFSLLGFATKQVLELKGNDGIPYKFMIFNNNQSTIKKILTEESKKLNPGQTVIVMSNVGNEENHFAINTKPVVIDNIEELSSILGEKYTTPLYIPEGFSLKECTAEYKYTPFSEEAMAEEGRITNKEVLVKVLEPTNEINVYELMYAKGEERIYFQVRIFDRPEVSIGSSDFGQSLKKVMIKDMEAAYTEDGYSHMLSWLKGSGREKIAYNIRYLSSEKKQGEVVKEMLTKIAENIK